jgi:hypothetical protein
MAATEFEKLAACTPQEKNLAACIPQEKKPAEARRKKKMLREQIEKSAGWHLYSSVRRIYFAK